MEKQQKDKIIRFLIYGIMGGILTMIGDCLLLGVDATGTEGIIEKYVKIASEVSYTRIGLGGFFGFIGIPLTVFGFYVIYILIEDKTSKIAKLYRISLYGYLAFGGAIHIISCYLVTGLKKNVEIGIEDVFTAVLKEQAGYLIPSMVVFFIFYFINVITMVIIVAKKKTLLPGWMWIVNPLVFKIIINAIGKFGNNAFFNGLACSNMSLGAIIIMVVWMIVIHNKYVED